MELVPVKIEYFFEVMHHTMHASVEHLKDTRQICYYFDEKLVAIKEVPSGDFMTDSDCICGIVEEYSRSHTDMFADLFGKHTDQVRLVKKTVDLTIEDDLFSIEVGVVVENGSYALSLTANGGQDAFTGRFAASSFSEALEKTRILISTLDGASGQLSEHISQLSNDRVMQLIRWQ